MQRSPALASSNHLSADPRRPELVGPDQIQLTAGHTARNPIEIAGMFDQNPAHLVDRDDLHGKVMITVTNPAHKGGGGELAGFLMLPAWHLSV